MAKFSSRFVTTVEDRLDSVPIQDGQLIFVSDSHAICLDKFGVRDRYNTIIELAKESDRLAYVAPIRGFYFVVETKVLWRYDRTTGWAQLNATPNEKVVFSAFSALPVVGIANTLYITETDSYYWSGSEYVKLGQMVWEVIE